jgi:hypothetical protein
LCRNITLFFSHTKLRRVVITLLFQAFVTWNLINHKKFSNTSHALTLYATKFANWHEKERVACQELLSGVSLWLWNSLSVTENFFNNTIGNTPVTVVAFINSTECCKCFFDHIHPFGCGIGNTNALSLFPYGPEWGGLMLMLAALPNVSKNDTYWIEESVVIMDNRISSCIPTVKEPIDFAADVKDEDEPCYSSSRKITPSTGLIDGHTATKSIVVLGICVNHQCVE